MYENLLALGVLIPLISFAILAFWGAKIGKPKSSYIACAAIGLSCIMATYVLIGWSGLDADQKADLTFAAANNQFHWADFGKIPLTVGVKLDSLTVIMFFMVTFIAFWIHFFSVGYMEGHSDEVDGQCKYHRFFAYLSLFCFSMLGLVISSSLLFMFIFWELVGLCSYLLIGFYFDKKFASDASMKAFITNRVGDFGFIVGLALVALYLGTFDLEQAAATFSQQFSASAAAGFDPAHSVGIFKGWNLYEMFGWGTETDPMMLSGLGVATLMGIGLFCGAMGKSAQFPLHVWLPDAMAGPTPVSALIHAATMVAAGVYLVARVFRLLTPEAQFFVAVIGCITLTITALIAIVQNDIKKVLAYSTLSQLGYMIFGMGVGAWVAALFHLMTHAFFKAMLFLGSGQVIEGCHHEQNIMKMGGLRKKMPFTCWTFFIGVLAIAGFGIPFAHIGLGGYFSKDEILVVAYERAYNHSHGESSAKHAGENLEKKDAESHVRLASMTDASLSQFSILNSTLAASGGDGSHAHGTPEKEKIGATLPHLPKWMFWLPIVIAYVTPFYMMRCWWLTFMGKPRDEHVYEHAHENWKMFVPLVVLAAGTFWCSFSLFRPMIAEAGGVAADAPAVVAIDGVAEELKDLPKNKLDPTMLMVTHGEGLTNFNNPHIALGWIVGFAWIIGMGFAWLIYRNGVAVARQIKQVFPLNHLHRWLEQKLYFDHIYDNMLVMGSRVVGTVCYTFDKWIVDGLVNLTGILTRFLGNFTGRQLDMPVKKNDFGLVDAIANGLAALFHDFFGSIIRRPQSGRIRSYVILTAGTAAVVLLLVLF
ncbi:MAG: NADH-quinone oxidoreductase subunit L [Phycisphaerales bacterium]|nr:NADH-quinone oxidoreductase subunit L [Phycisphaerales bacterium]